MRRRAFNGGAYEAIMESGETSMKVKILCGAAVVALLSCAPVSAVSAQRSDWQAGSSWNHDDFWRGASSSPLQRVDFLQRRIERGRSDGSLDWREARRVQYQLNS